MSEQEPQIVMTRDQLEEVVEDVTKNLLSRMGFEVDNMAEVRKDTAHLRRWRLSVDKVGNVGLGAAVTTIVSGVLAAIWIGFSHFVGRG